MVKLWGVWRIT